MLVEVGQLDCRHLRRVHDVQLKWTWVSSALYRQEDALLPESVKQLDTSSLLSTILNVNSDFSSALISFVKNVYSKQIVRKSLDTG